jgi:hypothetical protein
VQCAPTVLYSVKMDQITIHCKKSFSIPVFPSPAGMSPTELSLSGNNDVIYKLFPLKESLVSDIRAGDGNIEKLFYSVRAANSKCRLFLKIYL